MARDFNFVIRLYAHSENPEKALEGMCLLQGWDAKEKEEKQAFVADKILDYLFFSKKTLHERKSVYQTSINFTGWRQLSLPVFGLRNLH